MKPAEGVGSAMASSTVAGAITALPGVAPCRLGESPFWHPAEQVLYWCDIPGRRVHRFDPERGQHTGWDMPSEPGCIAPLLGGGLVVALRQGLARLDTGSGDLSPVASPPYDPAHERFNDGKADPQGRLWVGTVYEPRDRPSAALYCYDRGELQRRAADVTVSNGLGWSVDARTLYWADTKAHVVHAFDFDAAEGRLSRQREFARFAPKPPADHAGYGGRPDGAAVDAEGAYWVAMYEGARLLRLSAKGETLQALRLPVSCPTMPCFGGPDLCTLYVTTGRDNRPAEELAREPLAGCVLQLRVDVPGLPVNYARL